MSDRHSAHFFARTLNTISTWCPEDHAKAADVAVRYLISNFHLIHHEQDLDTKAFSSIQHEWTALWLSDIESLRRLTYLDRAYTTKSPGSIVRFA
ncbi:hypothetical protein EMCG_01418 [[Emmonsia] crescens]|uniref:Uncharacterized protein n=1 Tax=[Emmonsia] crescens TaxID=73230 RepID=A0A0G2J2Y5_9EURO|nr:hypothetical protein EMCG_01418 [Emmonsia crescens UAMH 3008]